MSVYGQGGIRRRPNSPFWWAQFSHNGKDIRKSTKIQIADDPDGKAARRWLHKRLQATAARTYEPSADRLMFEDGATMLLNDYAIHGYVSIGAARASLANLRRHFGNDKLRDVTLKRIEAYKAARLKDAAKGTIDHELAMLRRMFSLAIEFGRLATKPKIKMLPLDNARQGFCEPSDFARLLGCLPDDGLRDLIEFRYLASWRPKEARTLLAADVDLEGQAIRLRACNSKNGHARLIKLSGRLLEVVTRAYNRRNLECPNLFQRNCHPVRNFTKAWKNACKAAGLAGLQPHDLRRSGVRNMVRAGIPEAVAMRISGHLTRRVFERYNIVSEGDLDAAAERLDAYLDQKASQPSKVAVLADRRVA
jgi:integrase